MTDIYCFFDCSFYICICILLLLYIYGKLIIIIAIIIHCYIFDGVDVFATRINIRC